MTAVPEQNSAVTGYGMVIETVEVGVEQCAAEGTHAAQQRSHGGDHPAASGDQRGDRRVRYGQAPERENGQRPRQVQLSRVAGRDGQDLERIRTHPGLSARQNARSCAARTALRAGHGSGAATSDHAAGTGQRHLPVR
jgi:hypothetical protein